MFDDPRIILIIVAVVAWSGMMHVVSWRALATIIDNDKFPVLYTPKTLYSFTKMNWFGCIMIYILLLPFTFTFQIGGILKWLFTVGRKDSKR